jgi:hypothetical protein
LVDVEAQRQRCGLAPFPTRYSQRGPENGLLPVRVGELDVGDREPSLQLIMAADHVQPLVGLGVGA